MLKMSVEAVKKYFEARDPSITVIESKESSATVDTAASALGVDPDFIAKTLAFHLDGRVIIIVASGRSRIDNKKYKDTFQTKAKMLSFEEVEPLTGHPVGGLCPFALKSDLKVYLDRSIQGKDFVYPAAGSPFHALKISPQRLRDLTNAEWIDVCSK